MRYWDSSAIVPLVVAEAGTALARRWLKTDSHIVTWGLTLLELTGAVERRARQESLSAVQRRKLLGAFSTLATDWDEVVDLLAVRKRAQSLLARHALRAADAAQLASALVLAENDPSSLEFVCLDHALADAADREGFPVLTWPDA